MYKPLIQKQVSLRPHNTFAIDVRADHYCVIDRVEQLIALQPQLQGFAQVMVLGGGSNVLFCEPYAGLIIHNKINGKQIEPHSDDEVLYRLGGGENWHSAVRYAVESGYYGIENLSLIPGTVGAAPVQNIGAYGVELKDVFVALTAMELATGKLCTFDREAAQFGYRDSLFKQAGQGRYCIVEVVLKLKKQGKLRTDYGDIQRRIESLSADVRDQFGPAEMSDLIAAIRREKLPDPAVIPNAGSFFKNPVIDKKQFAALQQQWPNIVHYPQDDGRIKLAAGWLIDQLGWKGQSAPTAPGAKVHDRQALVLVNTGGGADAICRLAQAIQESVMNHFGVMLEPEPVWVSR